LGFGTVVVRNGVVTWVVDYLWTVDVPIKQMILVKFCLVIQGVNKYMLQRSVVDRLIQCDHILLIHPCPETLCLRARTSEM
jgi:hypothetical protein